MLSAILIMVFLCVALIASAFFSGPDDERPTLKWQNLATEPSASSAALLTARKKNANIASVLNAISVVFRPLVNADMRKRLVRDISIARWNMTPEGFMMARAAAILIGIPVALKLFNPGLIVFAILFAIIIGYLTPDFFLNMRIGKVKAEFVKQLPDIVDLLGLCVSAGLDFMMALKWVVEKSAANVVTDEMGNLLQEISVGKPRRDALRDMAFKYELTDLSTFSRTLIQADKMGTSVSEALTILSEDMRIARFRRGEAVALKAPLKMLLPLLVCIFPVVAILVGGPIMLDFMQNNPLQNLGG